MLHERKFSSGKGWIRLKPSHNYECDLVWRSARRLYAERKTRGVSKRHGLRTFAPFGRSH